jgi:hypothetical protein
MKLLLVIALIILIFSSAAFAQSFKEKVLFSPDIAFLWNFQRGFEELYRVVKFTHVMRFEYSLELSERRIGEMEVLIEKNNSNMISIIENEYEIEIDKIQSNMNSTDIFSRLIGPVIVDIKENVTQRLNYNNKVLNVISKNAVGPAKTYLSNAMKKTSNCIDSINKIR